MGLHSATNASLSSCKVLGCTGWAETACWSMSQACSIWFKSGDRAGQSICTTVSRSRRASVTCAQWGWALWSIRIKHRYMISQTDQESHYSTLLLLTFLFQQHKVSFSIDANACPNHDWTLAIAIMFCHIQVMKSLFEHSPHQLTFISEV